MARRRRFSGDGKISTRRILAYAYTHTYTRIQQDAYTPTWRWQDINKTHTRKRGGAQTPHLCLLSTRPIMPRVIERGARTRLLPRRQTLDVRSAGSVRRCDAVCRRRECGASVGGDRLDDSEGEDGWSVIAGKACC